MPRFFTFRAATFDGTTVLTAPIQVSPENPLQPDRPASATQPRMYAEQELLGRLSFANLVRPGNLGAVVMARLLGPATAVTDRVEIRSASTVELPPDEAAAPSDLLQEEIALSGEWSVPFLLEPRDALAVHHAGAGGNSGLQLIVAELDTPVLLAWVAAKASHPHLAANAPSQIDVGDDGAVGVSTRAARADHQHALPAPGAPVDITKAAASAGVATTVARADHKHDVSTAAPVTAAGTTSAEGTASSLARSDHVHRTELEVRASGVPAGSRPRLNFTGAVSVADNAGTDSVDVAVTAAVVTAAAPTQIDIGDAAQAGVASEAARADHQHALPAPAAPANVNKSGAFAGASSTVARADHKHDVSTASAVTAAGATNSEGTSTNLARSDHVHRTEIEVRSNGTLVGSRPSLNFASGLSCSDNPGQDRVDVSTVGVSPSDQGQNGAAALAAEAVIMSTSITLPAGGTGRVLALWSGSARLVSVAGGSASARVRLRINGTLINNSERRASFNGAITVDDCPIATHGYLPGLPAGAILVELLASGVTTGVGSSGSLSNWRGLYVQMI